MKRLIVTGISLSLLAVLAAPGASSAESYNENTGCGLGNQLFKEIGQDSILFQILAVTTNGILGNQTFGITSGTLGCRKPSKVVFNEKVERFVAANMDSIALDMARGGGESLDTLAELMSVPAGKKPLFFSALQANFNKIYASENVQSADVIDNIAAVLPRS